MSTTDKAFPPGSIVISSDRYYPGTGIVQPKCDTDTEDYVYVMIDGKWPCWIHPQDLKLVKK